MTGTYILILTILAILLMAIEIFIIPGFGLSGVGAAICAVAADVLIYCEYGGWAALGAVCASAVIIWLLYIWFKHSKTVERLSLHSTIQSTSATEAQLSIHEGDKGRALTRLALVGNAEIEGKTVEVKSASGFIEEGTPVEVVSVNAALILVRPI